MAAQKELREETKRRKAMIREAEAARRVAEKQESTRLKDLRQAEKAAAQARRTIEREEIQRAKVARMEQVVQLRFTKATKITRVATQHA
jgi:hypothetical protein